MALFHIQRYMGEEESNFGENRASSESILKRLHEKAKAREKQSHSEERPTSHDRSHDRSHDKSHNKSHDKSDKGNSCSVDREAKLLNTLPSKRRKLGDTPKHVKRKLTKKVNALQESKVQRQKSGKCHSQKSSKRSSDDLHFSAPTADLSEKAKKIAKKVTKRVVDESPAELVGNKYESNACRSDLKTLRENAKTAKKLKAKSPPSASDLKSAKVDRDLNRADTHKLKDINEKDAVIPHVTEESLLTLTTSRPAQHTVKETEETSPKTRKRRKRKLSKVRDDESEKHQFVSVGSCEQNKKEDVSVKDSSEFDGSNQPDSHDCASNERSSDDANAEEMECENAFEQQESITEVAMDPGRTDDAEGRDDEGIAEESEQEADVDEAFAVLGNDKHKKKQRVARVLPDWLTNPTLIEHDLKKFSIAVGEIEQLDARLVRNLLDIGIKSLFPVQRHVIPVILDSVILGLQAGDAGYRPRDLCVSAPTGSGKTLAFALPIVQTLLDRVVPRIRALVVLPTRDLAQQVSKVFTTICKGTNLRTSLIGGLKKFSQEQRMLVQTSGESQCDIVVATPGRLVDHINKTRGFTLQSLRFLVIDEADRMMDQISKDWISQVEKCVFVENRHPPGPITVETCRKISLPLQKLLFSATLSQNPEKLIQLNLFRPRLITSGLGNTRSRQEGQLHDGKGQEQGEFVGKYTTPVGLTEYYIQCTSGEKPLVILHLIQTFDLKQILCFTNTVEATHRLYHLIKLIGGIEVAEFSSNQTVGQRRQILKQFKTGKIQLLFCSDAMARGMDVENAKYVISYDMPPYIKTYIHRVGRTARAGKIGIAFSLLQQYEVPKLLKLLKHSGKPSIQVYSISGRDMDPLAESYKKALQRLPGVLRMEKAHTV